MNTLLRFGLTLVALVLTAVPAYAATPWYDLKVVDGRLMLPTEIAGIPGESIIDTGAQVTGLNTNFVDAQGLDYKTGRQVTIRGVYGDERLSTYRKVEGSVLGTSMTFGRVAAMDLGNSDVQLLLGAHFFEDYIFQFDYTNERMRLFTRDEVDLKSIKNVESKKDHENNQLVVRVEFGDNEAAWLMMDTGSTGGIMVERSMAEINNWIGEYPTTEGTGTGNAAGGRMEFFRIPSMDVGSFSLENVLVSMPAEGEELMFFEKESETGTKFSRRNLAQGLIGYEVLKHFVVTIDFERGHVHFYPGEKVLGEQVAAE